MPQLLRYDHYRILGVPRNASPDRIKRAYRERAKYCHPDRNGSPKAASIFHAVHNAYSELIDPERRQVYDDRLQFYRESRGTHDLSNDKPTQRRNVVRNDRHDTDLPVNRFAFVGLHVTGFCFGVILITGILVGISFFDWPFYMLVFCIPGLVVLPDSIEGIRMK